jgi:hypothetical protein
MSLLSSDFSCVDRLIIARLLVFRMLSKILLRNWKCLETRAIVVPNNNWRTINEHHVQLHPNTRARQSTGVTNRALPLVVIFLLMDLLSSRIAMYLQKTEMNKWRMYWYEYMSKQGRWSLSHHCLIHKPITKGTCLHWTISGEAYLAVKCTYLLSQPSNDRPCDFMSKQMYVFFMSSHIWASKYMPTQTSW